MADIVAAMASVHRPPVMSASRMADEATWGRINIGFDTLRATLTSTGTDTVAAISDEHCNALDPRRHPSFGAVTAETSVGPVGNWLGVSRNSISVSFEPELAEAALDEGVRRGFDLTRIGEAGLDHGFVACLNLLTPQWDMSYLWLIQNWPLPPLPSLKRCYAFGRMVGQAIRARDSPCRVALLGTGGLSYAVAHRT